MKLAALDLDLLVVLDALLAEKSVSGAARRLNSTQPAVSRALGKLRAWFGDPLLTRTRTGMAPTAMGLRLAAEVRGVVDRIQGFVDRRESFEPASAKRTFRLTMTDFPQHVVCGPLLTHLAGHAPGIDVEVRPWSLDFPDALEAGTLDAAVSPPIKAVSGLRSTELVRDDLVLVVRRDTPPRSARRSRSTTTAPSPTYKARPTVAPAASSMTCSRRAGCPVASFFVFPARSHSLRSSLTPTAARQSLVASRSLSPRRERSRSSRCRSRLPA